MCLCVLRGGNNIFSYDANGNRLNLTENKDTAEEIQTVHSILANSNRLTKVADTDYQYDHNGNIINDGEHGYTYDARNRLIQVDTDNSYLYNANNMRVKKTTVNGTTIYGWDNDRIFAEYDASGNPIQETVYFGSTPIALIKDGNTYRIFADQIDTPRVITDSTNNTLWAWDSKPFGETKPNEDVDGDNIKLSYNLRFPGQYYDAETGKHYNFNRDYDPVTGRYVQSDPIGLDGGMNGYGYVSSNTLIAYDLNGLLKCNCRMTGNSGGYGYGYWNGNNWLPKMKICHYSCSYKGKSITLEGGSQGTSSGYYCYGAIYATQVDLNGNLFLNARGFSNFSVETKPGWWERNIGSKPWTDDYIFRISIERNIQ